MTTEEEMALDLGRSDGAADERHLILEEIARRIENTLHPDTRRELRNLAAAIRLGVHRR